MVYVKKEGDIETIKIKGDRCYHYIGVKKEKEKSELQRRVELINKLGKYRPKIKVENRMIRDDVWMDVLDMAIKSKEYNQKD